jgi:glycine hydroxymethyltransferase
MRFGSPAVTTRGFGEAEMREVAALITRVLENVGNGTIESEVRARVSALTSRFPLYPWKLAPAVAVP